MGKLQINNEHKALIESVIRENPKFKGHEYLIDVFCDAIYKKSYLLIDAIRDMSRLKRHLTMISDSCMDQIIAEKRKFDDKRLYNEVLQKAKNEKKLVSLKKNVQLTPPKKQYDTQKTNIVNLKEEIQKSEKYDAVEDFIDPIEYSKQRKISENTVEKLVQLIKKIDKQYPQKKYYEIFSMRYIKKCFQSEIAHKLKISQMELSKRYIELVSLTKDNA